jgi:hypothetical protein
LKRKLIAGANNNTQAHLKMLDKLLSSKIVKKYTQAQSKTYLSSKVTDAIEVTQGYTDVYDIMDDVKESYDQP